MKAIVTVIGKDKVGIIAAVSAKMAQYNINILDISQTTMQEYFTMIMMVDMQAASAALGVVQDDMARMGEEMGLSIRIQHEDIFNIMHRV